VTRLHYGRRATHEADSNNDSKNFEDDMHSSGIDFDYWKRAMEQAGKMQVTGEDIPPVQSVLDLKSGVRAKLVDRSGSMVIIEVEKYRSDWIEWSEVKARVVVK
jgi:hypothetical protein